MSPGLCCYFIGLYKPLIIVSVQGYLMLIATCILFHHQTGRSYSHQTQGFCNHTLFCTLQRFSSTFLRSCWAARWPIFLYAYIFALRATNSVMIFPPSSSFIKPITFFYFFRWVVACFHPLNIHSYQTFSPHLLQCPCKIFSLYLLSKADSIHIAQLNFVAILRSHVVVMKLIH